MRKALYILLLLPMLSFGQRGGEMLIVSQQQAGGTPIPDMQNAADPINEVNGIANTDDNGGVMIITSQAPQNGSYYLRFEHNNGTDTLTDSYFTLVGVPSGVTVTVTFYVYEIVGLSWSCRLDSGHGWTASVSDSITGSGGAWVLVTLIGTTNSADPEVNIRGTSTSDAGMRLGVDNVTVAFSLWWILLIFKIQAKDEY